MNRQCRQNIDRKHCGEVSFLCSTVPVSGNGDQNLFTDVAGIQSVSFSASQISNRCILALRCTGNGEFPYPETCRMFRESGFLGISDSQKSKFRNIQISSNEHVPELRSQGEASESSQGAPQGSKKTSRGLIGALRVSYEP